MRKNLSLFFVIQILFLSNIFSHGLNENLESSSEKTFYISPSGNDSNTGTEEHPFLTLERAKLAIKNNMGKAIILYLRE